MKNLKLFSLFLLLIIAGFSLQAQNGNAVVSEVKVEDLGDGTGMIVVRISGNQASNYLGGTFSISGDRVVGGTVAGGIGNETRVIVEPPVIGNGNSNGNQEVRLAALFPLTSEGGNQSDEVTMTFRFRHRLGNGLDYTYSRVGRIRRTTGI